MFRSRILLAGLLAVAAVCVYFSVASSGPSEIRVPAPPLTIAAKSGPLTLASLRGKVVLVDFWATWCAPCRVSIPSIQKMYQKYHSQGFEVMGAALETDGGLKMPVFAKDFGMTYSFGIPVSREEAAKWGPDGIPLLVLVDKKGIARFRESGYSPEIETRIQELIPKLLAE